MVRDGCVLSARRERIVRWKNLKHIWVYYKRIYVSRKRTFNTLIHKLPLIWIILPQTLYSATLIRSTSFLNVWRDDNGDNKLIQRWTTAIFIYCYLLNDVFIRDWLFVLFCIMLLSDWQLKPVAQWIWLIFQWTSSDAR